MVCQWVVEHFGIIDALFLAAAAAAAAAAALSCHCTLSQGARSNISNHFNGYLSCSAFQDTLFPKLSCSDRDPEYPTCFHGEMTFCDVSGTGVVASPCCLSSLEIFWRFLLLMPGPSTSASFAGSST